MSRPDSLQPSRGWQGRLASARGRGLLSLGVLLAGMCAAGCGSSASNSAGKSTSSEKTVPAPAISKAEFVAKANAICARGNAANKTAGAKLGTEPAEAAVLAFVKGTEVPAVQAQLDSVRALGAPPGDAAKVTGMLDIAQDELDAVKEDPRIVYMGRDVFAAFAKLAHPYGLTACAPKS